MTDRHSTERRSAAAIRRGLRLARWSARDLWVAAVGIGGEFGAGDVQCIASGQRPATPMEHDILAAAINEHFVDRGENHPVRMWAELDGRGDAAVNVASQSAC